MSLLLNILDDETKRVKVVMPEKVDSFRPIAQLCFDAWGDAGGETDELMIIRGGVSQLNGNLRDILRFLSQTFHFVKADGTDYKLPFDVPGPVVSTFKQSFEVFMNDYNTPRDYSLTIIEKDGIRYEAMLHFRRV